METVSTENFSLQKTENMTLSTTALSDSTITNTSFYNSSIKTPPEGCLVIDFQAFQFIPWDNDDSLLTAEFEQLFCRLVAAWLFPILFLIGAPTNLISLAVFYKQGLKERINLCLFALSLADLLYLVRCMFLNAETMWTQFTTEERYGPISRFIVNNNLVGFVGFTWVSEVISAIIASERCFCILKPLHSQTVLKTGTMAVIITACFVVIVGLCFLVATRYRIVCVYDPVTEATSYMVSSSQFYFQHQQLINCLDSVVYGVVIPGASLVIVTLSTIVTDVKLRQAVSQRAQMSTSKIIQREAALTRMLICNSVLFIVCVLPIALFRSVLFFVPELNSGRRYHNTFLVCLWVLDLVSYINSSFNFFVYYTMGSRYRQTCKQLFCRWRRSLNGKPVSDDLPTISDTLG